MSQIDRLADRKEIFQSCRYRDAKFNLIARGAVPFCNVRKSVESSSVVESGFFLL
jgi:hypothetical protein